MNLPFLQGTGISLSVCLVAALVLAPSAARSAEPRPEQADAAAAKVTVEDVIPLTVGNLRGHKMLYNEGWFLVTSSSKALDFAKEKSIRSSGDAIGEALASASRRSKELPPEIARDAKGGFDTGKKVVSEGTELTGDILRTAHRMGRAELTYASESFRRAADTFVQGNLTIARRTEEDRKELAALPGKYFKDLKGDFSNIWDLTTAANEKFAGRIEVGWDSAFQKAGAEFRKEYDRSGESPNTLIALGPILYGYLKSVYHGLLAPSSKSIVKAGATGGTYAVFLPVAGATVVAGRTVQSIGLTFYYTGKTGIKLVSPTVESGLLVGMSVLSLSAVPVTYAAGGGLGAVNQVAFTTAGPVVGAGEGVITTVFDTATYVGFVTYDGVKGATKVVINQAQAGIVLGYNALTAVPTHLIMGVEDTAVFLAWDGPRLVIAAAQGRLKTGPASNERPPTVGDLPVGTVVDLKKLEQSQGIKTEVISTEPAVIRDVLERLPDDLRSEGGARANP